MGTEIRYRDRTDKDMTVPGYPNIIFTFGTAYRFLDAPVKKRRAIRSSGYITLRALHRTSPTRATLRRAHTLNWEAALVFLQHTYTQAHTQSGNNCFATQSSQSTTTAMLAKLAAHPPVELSPAQPQRDVRWSRNIYNSVAFI